MCLLILLWSWSRTPLKSKGYDNSSLSDNAILSICLVHTLDFWPVICYISGLLLDVEGKGSSNNFSGSKTTQSKGLCIMIQSCQPHVLFELLHERCPVLVICYCLFCQVVHSPFKQYFCLTPHKGVQYESLPSYLLVVAVYRFVIFKCSFYTSLVFCSSRSLIFISWGGLIIYFNVFFKYFFQTLWLVSLWVFFSK